MNNIQPTRVKNTQFINKIMSARDAAALIPNGAMVGFSGFVGSGCPLVVPVEIANRAKELHAKGEEYQIKALSGASTDINLDGVLAEADAVSFRSPFITDRNMRGNINTNKTQYLDMHLSTLAQQVEAGFFGKLDFAVIEIIGVTEDGKLIPSTSIGNNQVWLNVADKVILEVNHFQPEQLEGVHDVVTLGKPPYRVPLEIKDVRDRIGTPYMTVDPDKVVAVVITETTDRVNKFTPLDDISKAIGDNVVQFIKQEEAAGRLPKDKLLPLQSGIGNVANAVLSGLKRAGYKDLVCYSEVIQDGLLELLKDGVVEMASAASLSLTPKQAKSSAIMWIFIASILCCVRKKFLTRPKSFAAWV